MTKFEGLFQPTRIPLTKHCDACNDTGIFESGVCHCGTEMTNHNLYDNHTPKEMVGPCPYCERGPIEEQRIKANSPKEDLESILDYDPD